METFRLWPPAAGSSSSFRRPTPQEGDGDGDCDDGNGNGEGSRKFSIKLSMSEKNVGGGGGKWRRDSPVCSVLQLAFFSLCSADCDGNFCPQEAFVV